MEVRFETCRVAAGEEGSGLLVFTGEWLLAVLVRLGAGQGRREGHWYLETGYGRFSGGEQPVFIDQPAAEAWFASSLADKHVNDPWLA